MNQTERMPTESVEIEPPHRASSDGKSTGSTLKVLPGAPDAAEVRERLAAPFPRVSFKPQTVNGNRALAVAYIDARDVMERMDQILGVDAWQDAYQVLPDGSVICRLAVKLDGVWITKSDVGTRSDQADEGDQQKAAFTDALKRAAVKFGIGRYLYWLPKQWVGYDPERGQFTETPRLPAWALPGAPTQQITKGAAECPQPAPSTTAPASSNGTPRTGRELFRYLKQQEQSLVADRLCQENDLIQYVVAAAEEAGHGTRILQWDESGVASGIAAATQFIRKRKDKTT